MTTSSAPFKEAEHGHLLRNMLLFGRLLRAVGIKITPTQILDLVAGLDYVDIGRRADFKNTARTILVNHHEHIPLFDRAFDLFWQARDKNTLLEMDLGTLLRKKPEAEKTPELVPQKEQEEQNESSEEESDEPVIDTVYTYSAREVLRHKDFAELDPEELQEIKRLMQNMHWRLERRRTRRKTPAPHGKHIDMRRTFRQNLRYGGHPIKLTWRQRKLKRRPLVLICDISGSMERYARVLLKFVYAISNGLDHVEAFVFSTRLTRITRELRNKNIDTALDQVTASIQDWAGGTRIGDALKTFNYQWGRRVLGQGAIVMIISDGWDRGDIDLLGTEMNRLQLSCQRLIWLNPLLGSASYEPLTRGIQTALPYTDDFLPVHNLASLEQLGNLLEKLGEHKPSRPQHFAAFAD
jgi:uncharacterized protein with von Willebrand factor type A (vWA) domain